MSDKRTQTFSRILLTVFILAIMAPSLYYIFVAGMVLWGATLLVGGLVLLYLTWFWHPHGK